MLVLFVLLLVVGGFMFITEMLQEGHGPENWIAIDMAASGEEVFFFKDVFET